MPLTFAEFVIDIDAGELRRDGKPIRVEPQVFDLIALLASQPGRILSKHDIAQSVWHGRAISDSAISTRINAARRALGDDGTTQRFIKTVHGRGFRFEATANSTSQMRRDRPVRNWGAPVTTFVGRERELASLQALLQRPDVRLVSLTGVGGVGKTRIAQALIPGLEAMFRDGIWFVDLAPLRDADLVGSTIAKTLGLPEQASLPIVDSLRGFLQSRNLLLVLDNFEQVLSAADLVAELLAACPRISILVTSRSRLRLAGEHDFRVPSLSTPTLDQITGGPSRDASKISDAERLFIDRAEAGAPGRARTTEDRRAIAEICLRLDGLPLAIELAAARVRVLAPTELLGRLKRLLPILSAGPRDLPTRQQTLRNTVAWSHDLLEPREQRLFRQLSVFAGGFSADAAEAVVDEIEDGAALDTLSGLFDKSLVHRTSSDRQTRFSMLESIHEFAREQLADAPEQTALCRRHLAYFLDLARSGETELRGPRQEEWLARLAREHDNIRAALAWSLDDGADVASGAQLVGTLWWFWSVRGHFTEGRRWASRAFELRGKLDAATTAGVLRAMANFAFVQGDYAQARALARQAADAFEELGAAADAAWLLGLEAIAAQHQGDLVDARHLLVTGTDIARRLQHIWILAWMLRNQGRISHDADDDPGAAGHLEESLRLTRRIGDIRGIALSLHYLGVISLETDAEKASEYLDESIGFLREIDDRRGLAWALHYRAAAALDLGHTAETRLLESESLSLRRDLGDKRGIAECLEGHACLLAAEGQSEPAIRLFATAASLRKALGALGSPSDRRRVKQRLDAVLDGTGPHGAADAWRGGIDDTIDDAIAIINSHMEACPLKAGK